MKNSQIYYALRLKKSKQYLGVDISYNGDDAEFCGSYSCGLEKLSTSGFPHLFCNRELAEKAITHDVDWFNSSLESPMWCGAFKSRDEVEIVEISFPS